MWGCVGFDPERFGAFLWPDVQTVEGPALEDRSTNRSMATLTRFSSSLRSRKKANLELTSSYLIKLNKLSGRREFINHNAFSGYHFH